MRRILLLVLTLTPLPVAAQVESEESIPTVNNESTVFQKVPAMVPLVESEPLKAELIEGVLRAQEQTINQMSLFFSGLSLIVGLVSIVTPLLVYVFAIRPAQKVRKKISRLEKRIHEIIELKFEDYIKNYENNRINSYLNEIEFGDEDNRRSARYNMALSQYLVNSQVHIPRIYDILSKDPDEETRNTLAYILSLRDDLLSRHYFERRLMTDMQPLEFHSVLSFFGNFGITPSEKAFAEGMKRIEEKDFPQYLSNMFSFFPANSLSAKQQIIDNETIIGALSQQKRRLLAEQVEKRWFKEDSTVFQNSCLRRNLEE